MKKYVYIGTSENLNHRGYPTNVLFNLSIHKDCFYVAEAKLELKYLKYFKPLKELVERDTPMKQIWPSNGGILPTCPICGKAIMIVDNYCPNCGQALDCDNK